MTLVLTCVIAGVLLFICGWLMPAHLRAVDVIVIEDAGRHTHSVVSGGLASRMASITAWGFNSSPSA